MYASVFEAAYAELRELEKNTQVLQTKAAWAARALEEQAKLEEGKFKVRRQSASGLSCRNCGAPFEPVCSYCKTPR